MHEGHSGPGSSTEKRRILAKYIIGIAVIGVAISYYAIRSFKGSYQYYLTVSEYTRLHNQDQLAPNEYLKIAGTVAQGSIRSQVDKDKKRVFTFQIAEGGKTLRVLYHGIPPDRLLGDMSVVIEGRYIPEQPGFFTADKLITRCASKYSEGTSPRPSSTRPGETPSKRQ